MQHKCVHQSVHKQMIHVFMRKFVYPLPEGSAGWTWALPVIAAGLLYGRRESCLRAETWWAEGLEENNTAA